MGVMLMCPMSSMWLSTSHRLAWITLVLVRSILRPTLRVQKVKDLLLKTTKFSQKSTLPVEIGTLNNLLQIDTKAVISNASMHQNKLTHSCLR